MNNFTTEELRALLFKVWEDEREVDKKMETEKTKTNKALKEALRKLDIKLTDTITKRADF